jgi:hypothetical protein
LIVACTSCTDDDSRSNCNDAHHRCFPGHRTGLAVLPRLRCNWLERANALKKPNVCNLLHRPARPAAGDGHLAGASRVDPAALIGNIMRTVWQARATPL